MPTHHDRWRDAHGTPVRHECRIEQIPTTPPTRRGTDPAAINHANVHGGVTMYLPTRTLDWLAHRPRDHDLVHSVWDKLAELEQAGQQPGPIDALRRILTNHQPSPAGHCRTCRRWAWRHRPFPCIVWHQVRGELLGLFAAAGRQPDKGAVGTAATP